VSKCKAAFVVASFHNSSAQTWWVLRSVRCPIMIVVNLEVYVSLLEIGLQVSTFPVFHHYYCSMGVACTEIMTYL